MSLYLHIECGSYRQIYGGLLTTCLLTLFKDLRCSQIYILDPQHRCTIIVYVGYIISVQNYRIVSCKRYLRVYVENKQIFRWSPYIR